MTCFTFQERGVLRAAMVNLTYKMITETEHNIVWKQDMEQIRNILKKLGLTVNDKGDFHVIEENP